MLVTRDKIFSRVSKLHKHCSGMGSKSSPSTRQRSLDVVLKEEELGRALIREALARVPDRVLVVPYDELEWLREHHWAKILGFVRGGAAAAQSSLPVFRSGNRMWLDRSKVADLWALSPPLTNLSGEASLSQQQLERAAAAARYQPATPKAARGSFRRGWRPAPDWTPVLGPWLGERLARNSGVPAGLMLMGFSTLLLLCFWIVMLCFCAAGPG